MAVAPAASFVTCVVRIRVPRELPEAALEEWAAGIGEAQKAFPGFVSRRLIELPVPQNEPRSLQRLLKFAGSSTLKAYARMNEWIESDELKYWKQQAEKRNAASEDGKPLLGVLVEHRMVAHAVGMITVPAGELGSELAASGPPPKWRMCVLIEIWVFGLNVLHSAKQRPGTCYAKTKVALARTVDPAPLDLLIILAVIVPVIIYLTLPLTLAVPFIKNWVARRSPSTNFVVRTVEDGFELFTQEDPPPLFNDAVQRRFALVERRLEFLRNAGLKDRAMLEDAILHSGESTPRQARLVKFPKAERPAAPRDTEGPEPDGLDDIRLTADGSDDVETGADGGFDGGLDGGLDGGVGLDSCDASAGVSSGEAQEVTIVGRHSVRWECEGPFEDWCGAIEAAMRAASKEQFRGLDVFQEEASESATRKHVCVFRFSTFEAARGWLRSSQRAAFLAQLENYVDEPSDYDTLDDDGAAAPSESESKLAEADVFAGAPRRRRDNDRGERNLFGDVLMGDVRSRVRPPQPSLYKVAILSTFGLFLVSWPTSVHVAPALAGEMPKLAALLCLTSINVVLNVYFGAPLLYFFFSAWLKRQPKTKRPGVIVTVLVAGFPSDLSKVVALLAYFAALGFAIVF